MISDPDLRMSCVVTHPIKSIVKMKAAAGCLMLFLLSALTRICGARDSITAAQSLGYGETLVSSGEIYELGFFRPSSSKNRYVGIWYKEVAPRTVVWVANRRNPLPSSSGFLRIGDQGNILILDGNRITVWNTNSTNAKNPVLQLLDTGNLVLREEDDDDPDNYRWQSFDYPSDCLLAGMKLGWDLRKGMERYLTSWKSAEDPAPGEYTFRMDLRGVPEIYMYHRSVPIYRSGPWNGVQLSGVPEMRPGYVVTFAFVSNDDEIYYSYGLARRSLITRLVITNTGLLQRLTWVPETGTWSVFWWARKDQCDDFSECGPHGLCNVNESPVCQCLDGFRPKSQRAWFLRDASDGCVRKTPLSCRTGDGFVKLKGIKLPETTNSTLNTSLSLHHCREMCQRNCACTGYATADIRGAGTGCITWTGVLTDLRQYADGGQDFYLRLAAADLGDAGRKRRNAVVVSLTVAPAVLLLVGSACCLWKRKKKAQTPKPVVGTEERSRNLLLLDAIARTSMLNDKPAECRKDEVELPLFDLRIIITATSNFSRYNQIGEGGFGRVYKGELVGGQEIAVKRLSKQSGQGLDEFKNEVTLIAKLQHRNLVRLLGYCIQGEERMLVYEYMPNKSLDFFIFDERKKELLKWHKRFDIIVGIARGLLYLHQDSRLRIIHRDLKAGNILLDSKLNPKISDFGMARMFGGDQTEGNTQRVVGTYGYMAPEYAMDGLFSIKSDVFSFGVLVLEILSGKKNRGFYQTDRYDNLLAMAWELWKEGKGLELIDPSIDISCSMSEMLRCIHVGLLCVQEHAEDRPTMSAVVLMLSSENCSMQQPKQPGFVTGRTKNATTSSPQHDFCSVDQVTITKLEAR